jgi:[protein-PII] uridylyltransferase
MQEPVTSELSIREDFLRTRDASAMLEARTSLVDRVVRERWSDAETGAMPGHIALVAVGGYGRRELFPFSDIDLLILTPDEKTQDALKEPLSLCIRDLWDRNLRISQSVHTVLDCNQIDTANAELAVSLLDRRFLSGDEALFKQIRDPKPELGRNIALLTRERHTRFQDTLYHLEPNVKDAPGGLRDLQVLRWLAKLGAGDAQVPPGSEVLFRIRCYLHYLAGRDDNKFSFNRQDEIAALLGVEPEDLMRDYYRAVRGIARIANRRLDRFEAKRSPLFSQFRDRTARLSNSDFSIVHGEVFFRSSGAAGSDPQVVLRLFDFVARHGLPLSADSEERVERNIGAFQAWAATQPAIWPAFREILRQPHAAKALRSMHGCGALFALFPELAEMDALVTRDFNHRYTVDEHTMVAIQAVLDLRGKQNDMFADLASETKDLDLLATALLFHDVGKGTPEQDHVEVSRAIAEAVLGRSGISERALGVVTFLISSHLLIGGAIFKRDLSDPATIRDIADKTGTVERLKLLVLLTYGDISAVNPQAMTPWRRQLLWNVYAQTYAELTRELGQKLVEPALGTDDPELRRFLEGLPPRYTRVHVEKEIREHLRLEQECRRLEKDGRAKGVAAALTRDTAWNLAVVATDRPFLFASVAATLSSFGFNILKAEAFSNAQGVVIDSFTFADPARNLELNPAEVHDVVRTVIKVVRGDVSVEELLRRRARVKPDPHALAASRLRFDNEASPSATLIELVAQDRPGLLYDVAAVISGHGGNIEVVLVDTEAKKAIDVFYVTKAGAKLSDEDAAVLVAAIGVVAKPA